MKINYLSALMAVVVLAAGCNSSQSGEQQQAATPQNNTQEETYEVQLQPLNAVVTGQMTTGEGRFVISGDTMKVTIDVKNAPAGIEHWQHFHGFANDSAATCATNAEDKNGDGIIDVVETGPVSGTTMVPFNALPQKMDVGSSTYPVAAEDGSYHYEAKIPMDSLNAAFARSFGGSALNLDKRVLYIHGVPASAKLPKSVASIADIPASITLPIACGQIVRVNN